MKAWQDFNDGLFNLTSLVNPRREFNAKVHSFRLGSVVLGEISVTGNTVRRDPKSLKVDDEGFLTVRLHRSGHTTGVMGDKNFTMTAGLISLFDFHQPIHAKTEDVDYVSLTVRHSAIGYDPSKHSQLMQFSVDSPLGQMLSHNLTWLLSVAPKAQIQEAHELGEGICGLLKGLLNHKLCDETTHTRFAQSREVAVRRYLAAHLKDEDLDCNQICAALGLSRAVLYRIFENEGGVHRAIQLQRLEGAHEQLAYSETNRGLVGKVAREWAFYDQSHFARLFKDTYGFTASEAVGRALHKAEVNSRGEDRHPCQIINRPLVSLYRNRVGTHGSVANV